MNSSVVLLQYGRYRTEESLSYTWFGIIISIGLGSSVIAFLLPIVSTTLSGTYISLLLGTVLVQYIEIESQYGWFMIIPCFY